MSSQFDRIFEIAEKNEIDPVCGMSVNPDQPSGGSHLHEGTIYYFCANSCRITFSESPVYFLENFGKHGH